MWRRYQFRKTRKCPRPAGRGGDRERASGARQSVLSGTANFEPSLLPPHCTLLMAPTCRQEHAFSCRLVRARLRSHRRETEQNFSFPIVPQFDFAPCQLTTLTTQGTNHVCSSLHLLLSLSVLVYHSPPTVTVTALRIHSVTPPRSAMATTGPTATRGNT